MPEFLILAAVLLFALFLVFGIIAKFKQSRWTWILFTFSIATLIGIVILLFFSPWSSNSIEKGGKVPGNGPKTETPSPDDGKNPAKENPPKENPPIQEPKEEEPKEETPDKEEKPEAEKPPAQEPSTPEKINVPADKIVDYTVVKGDTLWSIAKRADVTVEKIKQWNNLTGDTIYAGQILKLYGKSVEPEPSKEDKPPSTASSVFITNGSTNKKEIALTFDAGSDIVGIGILDVLKKHNIKATFFLTGKWVEKYPEYARRIANEGHEIGNHSYSHPDAVKTSAAAFKEDILKAEEAIKKATGKSPQPYFRFPFGSYNSAALKTVGEAGYPFSIQWSLDTIDWQQPSAEVIISRIEAGASNGDIILMHIGGVNTPEAVDKIIPWLKEKGYQLVTLTELLK